MNLDDRARRARNSLQDHVGSDLDIRDARSALDARNLRQRSDRRRARVAAACLTVVALLGGVAIVSSSGRGPDDPRKPDDMAVDDVTVDDSGDDRNPTDAEILEAMPLGPTDGKESWRLPVTAFPQEGLQEGDVVTIYGQGFQPFDSLGVVHCSSEADTENAGVDGCDLAGTSGGYGGVQYVNADGNGSVVADVVVRRFIETPGYGRIDCASAPERCLLGMGAISDYDRSGGVYINFAGAPEFALPTFSVNTDPLELIPGQPVDVNITDWVPRRQIRIQQCLIGDDGFVDEQRCQPLLDTRAEADGSFTGTITVNAEVIYDDEGGTQVVPCGGSCVLQATGIGIPQGTTSPFPDPVSIGFVESGGETTTTHSGTTTTPPPVAGNPANPDASGTTIVVDEAETDPASEPGADVTTADTQPGG